MILCSSLFAQEMLYSLDYNPALTKLNSDKSALRQRAAGNDTLDLPFLDDFSALNVYPDTALWLDQYAFINNSYPVAPVTIGVATLDGLNQFGRPHNNGGVSDYGAADTLTSKPIDLSSYTAADSIYFSFLYQAQGLGDYPNEEDSLILEFKYNDTIWESVWVRQGYDAQIDTPAFTNVILPVIKPRYLKDNFQFRFRNYASINGNNDHWHIDYVKMDQNRTAADTILNDLAFVRKPDGLLQNYVSMPWYQFAGYDVQELRTNLSVEFRNNFAVDKGYDLEYRIEDPIGSGTLLTFTDPFNIDSLSNRVRSVNISSIAPLPGTALDSMMIRTTAIVNTSGDGNLTNDTVVCDQLFYNYYAYDDGIAEKAYGLQGPGVKKFAYEFQLNKPDTLRAIQFHFTNITEDPSSIFFVVYAWDSIDLTNSGAKEDTLYFRETTPEYENQIGKFVNFELDTPRLVSGNIYLGWQQFSEDNIQVGFDVNNDAHEHMFVYVNGVWQGSQVTGAPMIRPILGKKVDIKNVSVNEVELAKDSKQLLVYPNPSKDQISFDITGNFSGEYTYRIFNMQGASLISGTITSGRNTLDISSLPDGMFMIETINAHLGSHQLGRFVKLSH